MKDEVTDRYSGPPYPDPKTVCDGQCEGMGAVPISHNDKEEPWRTLWLEAEKKEHAEDGTHFVVCPDCNGAGKKNPLSKS